MTLQEDVKEYAGTLVNRGTHTDREVLEAVLEILGDDYPEAALWDAAVPIIRETSRLQAEAQQGWPAVTDCDRLDSAFAELGRRGIVARQDFTCCGTCGAAEIWDEIEEARDDGLEVRGYTFFHQQDTDHAVEGGGLFLGYGAVEEGEAAAVAIGREIEETLRSYGFETDWDGSWQRRIGLRLTWQRRRSAAQRDL